MKVPSALLALVAAAPVPAQGARSGGDPIPIGRLQADVGFLASDALQGRAAGSGHDDAAARYVADELERVGLRPAGRAAGLESAHDGPGWFQPFRIPKRRGRGHGETRNVLGLLVGTDPGLRSETVVVGAHHDHIGLGRFGSRGGATPRDRIHNGADDNASGTAGVLALARALAADPPRRSVLFATFSAEEIGLRGSRHYVRRPTVPLADTVAMINLDMIGRSKDGYLFVGGVGSSPAWPDLVERHLDGAGLRIERGTGGRAPSDSASFYDRGIPVLFLFTNVHEDYHRPTDHAGKIDYAAQRTILLGALALIRELCDRDERIRFTRADGNSMPKDFTRRLMTPSRAREMGREARRRRRGR